MKAVSQNRTAVIVMASILASGMVFQQLVDNQGRREAAATQIATFNKQTEILTRMANVLDDQRELLRRIDQTSRQYDALGSKQIDDLWKSRFGRGPEPNQ